MLSAAVRTRKSSRINVESKAETTEEIKINIPKPKKSKIAPIVPETPKTPTQIRKSCRLSSTEQSPNCVQSQPSTKTPTKQPVKSCPSRDFDCFAVAKRAFHRSGAFKIVGRVEEKAQLTSFWYDHVARCKGASIYISGNPGTGKTALVDAMVPELVQESSCVNIKVIKINCMMLKDPLQAFQEIAQKVNVKVDKNVFITLNSLESFFINSDIFHLIIIDEIDQIGMKDGELLCKLLAMPYVPNTHVAVIGIANSMDLTERFLPRLKLLNCEPSVLHFPQYTVPDIISILCDRLERINSAASHLNRPFMDKSAIELTSRKVASTGDLRRALDMLRQAIDIAEDEHKLTIDPTKSTGALVKLSHVVKIMEKFGSSQSGPLVLLKSLNLHQKVILAAITGFIPLPARSNVLTIQTLYEEYCNGARRPPKLYDPVTRSEFIDLISNLESMSIIGKSTASSESTSNSNSHK